MQLREKTKSAWALAATTALVALAGCTMFRGNVKGNFQCSAPGGMCAPSSSIDDQALAQIEQNALPAGNDGSGDARLLRVRAGQTTKSAGGQISRAQGGRGLKIVLPGHLDRYGRWREPQIVYADVSNAGGEELSWSDGPAARLSLAELASGAPSMADATTLERQQLASGSSAYDEVVRRSYQQGRGAFSQAVSARAAAMPAAAPGATNPGVVQGISPAAPVTAATLQPATPLQSASGAKASPPATSPKMSAPGFPGAPQGER